MTLNFVAVESLKVINQLFFTIKIYLMQRGNYLLIHPIHDLAAHPGTVASAVSVTERRTTSAVGGSSMLAWWWRSTSSSSSEVLITSR